MLDVADLEMLDVSYLTKLDVRGSVGPDFVGVAAHGKESRSLCCSLEKSFLRKRLILGGKSGTIWVE